MTDEKRFQAILPKMTADTIGILMQRNGWDENRAIGLFMRSEVYDRLKDEKTKVWHFSPLLLAQLFEDEMKGQLVWPEV